MYRKALVPTDGSRLSQSALRHVAEVLDPDGEVLLVEVIDSPSRIVAQLTPAGFDLGGAFVDEQTLNAVTDAQHEQAERDLASAQAILAERGIDAVETRIIEGLPGPEIVETAKREGCEVIVMATHGRSGLMRTFLGSVAEHVVRHTRGIPVLLVHPDEPADGEQAGDRTAARAGGAAA